MYEFYVGTTPKDPPGNIVKVCLDSDGQLVDKSYYEAVSPAYLCRKGSCIYAVIENADFGGVQVFDVNKNGSLTAKARLDTEDVYSTYISAEKRGNRIFVANYGTPSCAVYRYEAEKLVQESVLREKKTEKSHIFMPSDAAFIRLEGIRIRLVIKKKDKNVSIFFFMNFAVFIISMLLQFII